MPKALNLLTNAADFCKKDKSHMLSYTGSIEFCSKFGCKTKFIQLVELKAIFEEDFLNFRVLVSPEM